MLVHPGRVSVVQRDRALDSLRGLAAISVLLYHALATNSENLTAGTHLLPVDGFVASLLVYTPLHVVWLGAEAVWFFFILSGFVLTRAASKPSFSWEAYFPSRMVRLYIPVFAAVALAWLSYTLARALAVSPSGAQLSSYAPEWVMRDLTLVGGTSTSMGVLWSLQWEVIFSLALPLYLLLVRRHKVSATVVAVVMCLLGTFVNVQGPSILPMFFFGALLAQQWEWIVGRFRFLTTGTVRANVWGSVLTVAAVFAITSFFVVGRWLEYIELHARTITTPLVLVSICTLIILSMLWPPMRSLLSLRPLVFLGEMSYSLYLVHLPIVVIFVHVFTASLFTAAISLVVSLVAGCIFYRVVEKPSHRLAKRVALRQRLPQEPVEPVAALRR
jgi:peptidoglycan/LPS O-acetylase OafA/YrhL